MLPFQYRQIDNSLLSQLFDLLCAGESLVLLGPRGAGKRFLLRHLGKRLHAQGGPPIGVVEGQSWVSRLFPAGVGEHPLPPEPEEVIAWVDAEMKTTDRAVTLTITDVDDLPMHVAKEFLQQIRTRVEGQPAGQGRLRAVLTGSVDLRQLVHGPSSEFNCANQFALTGFGEEAFREIITPCANSLGLSFSEEPPGSSLREVHRRTGGNVGLFRLLLWAALTHKMVGSRPCSFTRFEDLSDRDVATLAPEDQHDRYLSRLSAGPAETWILLEQLLEAGRLPVMSDAPDLLELVGAAVRKGNELQLASPLAEELIRQQFTTRRFADLFAKQGMWPEAFDRYKRMGEADRCRPATISDVVDVAAVVKNLSTSLYEQATQSSLAVRDRFLEGCQYVLGFSKVTFWRRAEGWQLLTNGIASHSRGLLDSYTALLPPANRDRPRGEVLAIEEPANLCCAAALVPALRSDVQDAVIIGHPWEKTMLSRARQQLTEELLSHFVTAYSHAIDRERDQVRLRTREQHGNIVNGILAGLGTRAKDVGEILAEAASAMRRELGYSRVMFSLISPAGDRIRGVHEDSDDPGKVVMRSTEYPVGPHAWVEDIQQAACLYARSWIMNDAANHELANKDVVRRTGMKSAVVVPLANLPKVVIGTVHVERRDGLVPTPEEVADLEQFGGQLAIVIEQSERVNLLESALDTLREPVGILDGQLRIRYANKHAANCLGVTVGWHQAAHAKPFQDCERPNSDVVSRFLPELAQSLRCQERRVHHMPVRKKGRTYNISLLTHHILNWRDDVVGVFLHAQELTYLYRVFEALRLVQDATGTQQVIENTVEATKLLGHSWGRLYQLDSGDQPAFVSKKSYGSPSLGGSFDKGEVTLSPQHDANSWETWRCIRARKPVVFCHCPDQPDRARVVTARGLEAFNVRTPTCPPLVAKQEGDFWIDFPLIGGDRLLGKLTLHCPGHYNPEDWEFLRVLCNLTSELLQASLAWEKENEKKETWMRQSAEHIITDVCHHIGTSIAAFPALVSRYRQVGGNNPALRDLNQRLEDVYTLVNRQIVQTRERLTRYVAEKKRQDLVAIIHNVFNGIDPAPAWEPPSIGHLLMEVDGPRFESALLELIHNARQCSPNPGALRFGVTLELLQYPDREKVRLAFSDNGSGVPDEYKQRIFERFFSRRPQGETSTGQGLYFVRRVVEAHGGTIQESGVPGQGARFVIELPRDSRTAEAENSLFPYEPSRQS